VTRRKDHDLLIRHQVDREVLIVDPPRSHPGQVVPERLGFADPREGVTPDVLVELVDPSEHLAVVRS
jgi:hypothetical protein